MVRISEGYTGSADLPTSRKIIRARLEERGQLGSGCSVGRYLRSGGPIWGRCACPFQPFQPFQPSFSAHVLFSPCPFQPGLRLRNIPGGRADRRRWLGLRLTRLRLSRVRRRDLARSTHKISRRRAVLTILVCLRELEFRCLNPNGAQPPDQPIGGFCVHMAVRKTGRRMIRMCWQFSVVR